MWSEAEDTWTNQQLCYLGTLKSSPTTCLYEKQSDTLSGDEEDTIRSDDSDLEALVFKVSANTGILLKMINDISQIKALKDDI